MRRSRGKDEQADKKEDDNGEKMRRSRGKDEQADKKEYDNGER